MAKFLAWLLSPLGTTFCLIGFALLLTWCRRLRSGKTVGALALVWLWFWSMPATSNLLVSQIEEQFPQISIEEVPLAQGIVVLGGTVLPPSGKSTEINLGRAGRVWYAARLFHAGKAPLVLLSGGGLEHQAFSEARAMAVLLQDLGVPKQAILLEERSQNTRQNAVFTASILEARGIGHVLLVTSALHMPRALPLFEAQGLTVIPSPTDYESGGQPPHGMLAWVPDAGALNRSALAIKELVGKWINLVVL